MGDAMTISGQTILEAARQVAGSGRFNRRKVWVSAVVTAMGLDLEEGKAALLDAHRRGEVRLSRCDLTDVAEPWELEASRIEYLNAEFHLLEA